MAAPSGHVKLSKSERKIHKKTMKSKQTLLKHDGIKTSEEPTGILCVNNAGLGNGVTQEEVKTVCEQYGSVSQVIMLPQKPYCFVCFHSKEVCEAAHAGINGFLFRKADDAAQSDIYFYASYVSQVPASVAPSSEIPPGLILLENFVSVDCEKQLLEGTQWDDVTSDAERTLKHRKVKHYGYEFKYSINNVDPNDPLPEGVPETCREFLTQAIEQGVVSHYPDQLTVNQYEPGQGIPPHVDTPSAFEDGIMSLSLGSQVVMDFRHPDGRHLSVLLPPRSLLVMTGESRYVWSHGITPRKTDIVPSQTGLTLVNRCVRTSFTFRKLSPTAGITTSQKASTTDRPNLPDSEEAAVKLEHQHVHQVYEEIADHFSGTRHSAWPQIAQFLQSQPPGSLMADIGCGNGKYLGVNKNIFSLGSDRSANLAGICHERHFPVFVGDIMSIPLRSDSFDVCLCIAVIHHLSTPTRRCHAVGELLRILRPGGRLLIYVWAMEQERQKTKSKYLKNKKTENVVGSVEGEKENQFPSNEKEKEITNALSFESGKAGCVSDNGQKIPNVAAHGESDCNFADDSMKSSKATSSAATVSGENPSDTKPSLSNDSGNSCAKSLDDPSSKKLSIHVNRTNFKDQDMLVPWQLKSKDAPASNTFHRFYHVFKEGELESLCNDVGGSKLVKSYYDQGNWCVILEKI